LDQEHVDALPRGYQLHEYRIESVLGQGSFGITYLARDTVLDLRVAIKEFLPVELAARRGGPEVQPRSSSDSTEFHEALDRFVHEGQILARFQHANIVPIYRFFEGLGTAYTVMAYQEGESLASRLARETRLAEADLEALLLPLLDGLEEVHKAGILHRDIKPGNIYIRTDGTPVLLDFGAARLAAAHRSHSATAVVTAGYAPLEQYTVRGNQGPWSDIYALGAVCYRAVTGERPPEAPDRVRDDPMVPAAEAAGPEYGATLLAAIDRALAVHLSDRPPDVTAWRAMLEGRIEAVPAPLPAAPPAADRGRGRARLAWAGTGLAVLLLAAGVFVAADYVAGQQRAVREREAKLSETVAELEAARQARAGALKRAEAAREEAGKEAEARQRLEADARQREAAAAQEAEAAARRAAEAAARKASEEKARQQAAKAQLARITEAPPRKPVLAQPAEPRSPATSPPSAEPAAGPPWIGVRLKEVTPELARQVGLGRARGALVASVVSDGPAARAGVASGDIVLLFDGRPVRVMQELPQLVAATPVGSRIDLMLWRNRQPRLVTVDVANFDFSAAVSRE